jgi:hypothetical protein
MLDPQIIRCVALALGLLFLLAGAHKFGDRARFGGILANYRMVPVLLVSPLTLLMPLLELALGLFWLVAVIRLQTGALLPVSSALLLTVYALAIAVNLVRRRNHIDCGCGFAKNDSGQRLSPWLVFRNLLLAAMAMTPLLGAVDRRLGVADHLLLVLISVALILLYAAFNQLLSNQGAIASWRNTHG